MCDAAEHVPRLLRHLARLRIILRLLLSRPAGDQVADEVRSLVNVTLRQTRPPELPAPDSVEQALLAPALRSPHKFHLRPAEPLRAAVESHQHLLLGVLRSAPRPPARPDGALLARARRLSVGSDAHDVASPQGPGLGRGFRLVGRRLTPPPRLSAGGDDRRDVGLRLARRAARRRWRRRRWAAEDAF